MPRPSLNLPFLWIFFLTFISQAIIAQHDEHHHEHHHHTWEFGGGLGAVYNVQEEHFAPGIHLHLIRNIGEEKVFGIGLGFETMVDEHRHLNFGIPLIYNTPKGFVFAVTPGVLLKKETDWEASPSVHFEILYEFAFEHFHMGPMIELAYAPNDLHLMLGIHIGFGWK